MATRIELQKPSPFAMRFQETISKDRTEVVQGEYNPKTQTWDWPKTPDGILASGIQPERPATSCTVPTRIDARTVKSDTARDD